MPPNLHVHSTNNAIFEELILKTLEEIPYSRFASTSVLVDNFAVLDHIASLPQFPASIYAREYMLQHLLISLITERYTHQRHILGLEAPNATETRAQASYAMRLDTKQAGKQLLIWSVLYYRYVRIDLEFSLRELSKIVSCNTRTLRRYREEGIKGITHDLFWIEWYWRTRKIAGSSDDFVESVTEPTPVFLKDEIWWLFSIARRVLAS